MGGGEMGQLYTSGDWIAKEGLEQDFIEAWEELASWTAGNAPGSGWALLARDVDNPRRFRSFGPWEDAQSIEAWRGSDGFKERVGKLRGLLEGFEPLTLEAVVEVS